MNTILKTTLTLAVASVVFAGCSAEDVAADIGAASSPYDTGSNGSTPENSDGDSFTITKTDVGFNIDWHKSYHGYAEIIYKDAANTKPRGNGYPFTNNATGDFTLSCEKLAEDEEEVAYGCNRPDLTYGTSVKLKIGTQYQWLISYGTEHEHGEVEYTMEYSGGTLIVE